MTADVLRQAVVRIRHDCDHDQQHGDPAFLEAVADWLDAAYDDERRFAAIGAHGFAGENPAFAVARAYLGVTP